MQPNLRYCMILIHKSEEWGKKMTENIENLVLEQLRAIRADIASVKEDTREIKSRLIMAESGIASLRRDGG